MKHSFRGKSYRVRFRQFAPHERGANGFCAKKDKLIEISKHTQGEKLLGALLHEGLHACFWDLDEEAVEEAARALAALLWKLGWRETPPRRKGKS